MGTLIEYQRGSEAELPEVLKKLRLGKAIRLKVNDPKAKPSKRLGYCLLYIVPVTIFDSNAEGLMFAVEGGGCITLPTSNIEVAKLMLIGLGSRSAKLLKKEIARLFL